MGLFSGWALYTVVPCCYRVAEDHLGVCNRCVKQFTLNGQGSRISMKTDATKPRCEFARL